MRKLTAAGLLTAGTLGLALHANAAVIVNDITGTNAKSENACTQVVFLFSANDCSYGFDRAAGGWLGPTFGGGYYALGDPGDSLTAGTPGDGKLEIPITGTISIDDQGTADGADDTISGSIVWGAGARALATGQSSRAVERWNSITHTLAATPVNAATANGGGGIDYVIGDDGFPTTICSAADAGDCFPSENAPTGIPTAPSFWAGFEPSNIGIERNQLQGNNVGAETTAVIESGGLTQCEGTVAADCTSSSILWSALEDPGFDNVILMISTDAAGNITSATGFWTQEYNIGLGGSLVTNSWQASRFTFTGTIQGGGPTGPDAVDDAVTVLQDSTDNILTVLANDANLSGAALVVTIPPDNGGTATPVGDGTINYTPLAGFSGTETFTYEATLGPDTDTAVVTVTVEADILPVGPDGTITVSTLGVAPASATGTVDVSTLATYSGGNGTPTVSITTDGTNGTATASGTTITYTPAAATFAGDDTVVYTITDSNGDTDTGTITVTVTDVSPVINDGAITTDQDTASAATALSFTAGNGALADHTIAVTTDGTSGSCVISGTSVTYTPDAEFFGTDSCVVTITDGDGDTDTGTLSITVEEVSNDLRLPGGGSAVDLWSLSLLGALPLLRRRRRA